MPRNTVIWPDASNIPVCWERYSPEQLKAYRGSQDEIAHAEILALQSELSNLATREYARAGIHFRGWEACEPNSRGIRILWNRTTSEVSFIGRALDGLVGGLVFEPPRRLQDGTLEEPIEHFHVLFLHELGHTLGLRHEHTRHKSETECEGVGSNVIEPFAQQIGKYDSWSLLDYCVYEQPGLIKKKIELSEGDINALQTLYSGYMAEIFGGPRIAASPTVTFAVRGATEYRHKAGPEATTDCSQNEGYSVPTTRSRVDILTPALGLGRMRLCVLGGAAGRWQALDAYSSVEWRQTRGPLAAFMPLRDVITMPQQYLDPDPEHVVGDIKRVQWSLQAMEGSNCMATPQKHRTTAPFARIAIDLSSQSPGFLRLCLHALDSNTSDVSKSMANEFRFFYFPYPMVDSVLFVPGGRDDKEILETSQREFSFLPTFRAWEEMSFYRFKLVSDANACALAEGYSENVVQGILSNISTTPFSPGRVTLCVIAGADGGKWQPLESAKRVTWISE